MSYDIGTLIITASQPSKEYLNTQNYENVNISDYPQLYNIFYDNPFMNGYRQICVLPSTSINKFGYNNGLYWCTDNTILYYTTSLTQEWSRVQTPNSSWNISYIDCINNIWFICGEKYSSTFGGVATYIAYSNDISSWSTVPITSTINGNVYYFVKQGVKDIYYLNDSYIVKAISGAQVTFYQFTSLSNCYSDKVNYEYTTTPSVNISAANGIWYFSFDTSSGTIYHEIRNGTSQLSNVSTVFSCPNNCGNIKAEYKNGTYYIRTGNGVYASSSPNSGFSLISESILGIDYYQETNGYRYSQHSYPTSINYTKIGNGFNITKDFENMYYSCVIPKYKSNTSISSLYYNIQSDTMYAIIDGILYINDNTQFMIPYYKKGDDMCKTYIKAL